jgi:rSAM/selenodomain-associated transferase 2
VAEPLPDKPQFSIIIPVLNDADCLDQNLARLFALNGVTENGEVIISDGGSVDSSLKIASRYDCRVVHGSAGRALQMNRASEVASGRFLLFLHADGSLPENFSALIDTDNRWGFFRIRLSGKAFAYRVIESAINLRSRVSRVGGGDQGLYFERDFFESLGGYPEIPLMEDVAICKQARRRYRPGIINAAMLSSSRRWQEHGIVKTVLLMWSLRMAYWLGVDPHRLHRFYYPQQG